MYIELMKFKKSDVNRLEREANEKRLEMLKEEARRMVISAGILFMLCMVVAFFVGEFVAHTLY